MIVCLGVVMSNLIMLRYCCKI
ncbi:hypothetical protein AB8E32_04110 [Marinomonas polaris]